MNNNELLVLTDLASTLVMTRNGLDAERKRAETFSHDYSVAGRKLATERANVAAKDKIIEAMNVERQKYCDRIAQLEAERDSARRKLYKLVWVVGWLDKYDAKHPTRSLEAFKANVQKCIDDNAICMIEGGMAK